jgi:hypothetical protein
VRTVLCVGVATLADSELFLVVITRSATRFEIKPFSYRLRFSR